MKWKAKVTTDQYTTNRAFVDIESSPMAKIINGMCSKTMALQAVVEDNINPKAGEGISDVNSTIMVRKL